MMAATRPIRFSLLALVMSFSALASAIPEASASASAALRHRGALSGADEFQSALHRGLAFPLVDDHPRKSAITSEMTSVMTSAGVGRRLLSEGKKSAVQEEVLGESFRRGMRFPIVPGLGAAGKAEMTSAMSSAMTSAGVGRRLLSESKSAGQEGEVLGESFRRGMRFPIVPGSGAADKSMSTRQGRKLLSFESNGEDALREVTRRGLRFPIVKDAYGDNVRNSAHLVHEKSSET